MKAGWAGVAAILCGVGIIDSLVEANTLGTIQAFFYFILLVVAVIGMRVGDPK